MRRVRVLPRVLLATLLLLLLLGAGVLTTTTTTAAAAFSSSSLSSARPAFVHWPFAPDDKIDVRATAWQPGARVDDDTAQRLLVRAAVPLHFRSNDTATVAYLIEVLRFMPRTRDGGVCPALHHAHVLHMCGRLLFATATTTTTTTTTTLHDALELWFGARRLAALHAMRLPDTWRRLERVHGGRCGAEVACLAAQDAIAHYATVDPPGLVHVTMIMQILDDRSSSSGGATAAAAAPHAGGTVTLTYTAMPVVLPLADIHAYVTHVPVATAVTTDDNNDNSSNNNNNTTTLVEVAQLRLDVHASSRRRARQLRILAKMRYADGVAAHDAAIRAAAVRASRALATSRAAAAAAAAAQQRAQAELRAQATQLRQRRDDKLRHKQQQHDAVVAADAAASDVVLRTQQQAHRCDALRRVLVTLRAQGAHDDVDTRAVRARALQRAWHCDDDDDDSRHTSHAVATQTATTTTANVSCALWCDALRALTAWHRHTGDDVTVAQSLALLTAMFVSARTRSGGSSQNNVSSSNDNDRDEATFVRDLCAYSVDFVEQRRYAACGGCDDDSAAAIVAELHYASGILRLVCPATQHDDDSNNSNRSHTGMVRATLQLQQALWLGAQRTAASALATLREHGLLQRQHVKATVALLSHAMDGADVYTYRLLLSATQQQQQQHVSSTANDATVTTNNTPTRTTATAVATHYSAERLLRYERAFAVAFGWNEVDWPLLTRARLHALMHADEPTLHEWRYGAQGSVDAPPHNSNIYAEEADYYFNKNKKESNDDDDDDDDDDDSDHMHSNERATAQTPLAIHVENMLQKTSLQVARVRGVDVNARGAACRLLTVLRRMRYTCDVSLRRQALQRNVSNDDDDDEGACVQHVAELRYIALEAAHTRLGCDAPSLAPPPPRPRSDNNDNDDNNSDSDDNDSDDAAIERRLRAHAGTMPSLPPRLVHYRLLHHALVKLSYVYLLDAARHDAHGVANTSSSSSPYARVALYAMLSLRLSAAAYTRACADARAACTRTAQHAQEDEQQHNDNNSNSNNKTTTRWHVACATTRGRLRHSLAVTRRRRQWAAVELLTHMAQQQQQQQQQEQQITTTTNARRRGATTKSKRSSTSSTFVAPLRLPTWLQSPFVAQESLVLLAVSALLERRDRRHRHARRDDDATASATALLQHTLRRLFGVDVRATALRVDNDDDDDATTTYTCVYTLLAAALRWRSSEQWPSVLDQTRYSTHRTDAFLLLSHLLHDNDDKTFVRDGRHRRRRLVSLTTLRRVVVRWHEHALTHTSSSSSSSSSLWLQQQQWQQQRQLEWLLPHDDDTRDTYTRRLLRFAHLRAHAPVPAAELFVRGLTADDYGDMNDDVNNSDDDDDDDDDDERTHRHTRAGRAVRRSSSSSSAAARRRRRQQRRHRQQRQLQAQPQAHYYAQRQQRRLDRGTLSHYTLRAVRAQWQYHVPPHELHTLLIVRDAMATLATTRTTTRAALPLSRRLWRWLRNAVLYLYTQTDDEALLLQLSEQLLPARVVNYTTTTTLPTTARASNKSDDAATNVTSFVHTFVDVVATSHALRQLASAALLVSTALQLGTPHGFALLLADAAGDDADATTSTLPYASPKQQQQPQHDDDSNNDRARMRTGNVYLQQLADHLAFALWPRGTTAALWRDAHVTAQWQREKPTRTIGATSVFSLDDGQSLFRHAAPDVRVELAAQLDRWRARRLLQRAATMTVSSPLPSPLQLQQTQRQRQRLQHAAHALLAQCSGHLVYRALVMAEARAARRRRHTQRSPLLPSSSLLLPFVWPRDAPSPYDGALLPAASVSCLTELYTLLRRDARAHTRQQRQAQQIHTRPPLPVQRQAEEQEATLLRLLHDLTARLRYAHALSHTRPRDRLARSRDDVGGAATRRRKDGNRHARPGQSQRDDDDDDDNDDNDVSLATLRRATTQLVEPWRRVRAAVSYATLTRGEGVSYNARLHRLTGVAATTRLLRVYARVRAVCQRYTPSSWQWP